ncbi:MAG TPA: hypothetical protein VFV79_08815 [Saprospiraceae bacterium]|nr:hypothetical protein [Saprospiraceae bacterium]
MKYVFYFLFIGLLGYSIQSCKKDEGKLPDIEFKTGGNYTSSDLTVSVATIDTLLIGIHAEKTEEEDVLKHFNVSISLDGAPAVSVYDEDLTGADQDQYDADFTYVTPDVPGHYKIICTVTNRDGLTNNVSLTVTAN